MSINALYICHSLKLFCIRCVTVTFYKFEPLGDYKKMAC